MDSKADDIWVHFEDIGNTSAKCKLCQKTYSVRNASNLKSHLERSHNIPANVKGTTAAAPHQVLITSTTLPTDELLGKDRGRSSFTKKSIKSSISNQVGEKGYIFVRGHI